MLRISLIYTAVAAIAIALTSGVGAADSAAAEAGVAETAALEALREGTMKKLVFHASPKPVPDVAYLNEDGSEASLADQRGRHVLVNFWATWCAPCRKEMPGLDAVQAEFGGDDFTVLTIATGRNLPAQMKKFFAETGVEHLPLARDPKQQLARRMGVLGLPVSVLLDPEGNEIARMTGDAEWDSDSGRAILRTLLAR